MAIDFVPASSANLRYADNANYTPSAHTLSIRALVYFDTVAEDAYRTIISKMKESDNQEFLVGQQNTVMYFTVYGSGGTTCQYSLPMSTFSAGQWYDFLLTYNGGNSANNRMKFYVNGSEATSGKYAWSDADKAIVDGTAQIRIGTFSDDFPASRYFDGKMADVSIWNTELTSGNASTLYNGGAYKSGLFISTGLVFNARLTDKDDSSCDDEVQSVSPTKTGLADFTHPTVEYPSGGGSSFVPSIIVIN